MAEQFNLELFENDTHQNGIRYWIAHDFMLHLGYESWNAFKSVINKAMSSCANLEIDITFQGKEVKSYKLLALRAFLSQCTLIQKKSK